MIVGVFLEVTCMAQSAVCLVDGSRAKVSLGVNSTILPLAQFSATVRRTNCIFRIQTIQPPTAAAAAAEGTDVFAKIRVPIVTSI